MPQISRTALVPYSEQMYQLVNDVQSYPRSFFALVCWQSCPFGVTPAQMTAAADASKAGIKVRRLRRVIGANA